MTVANPIALINANSEGELRVNEAMEEENGGEWLNLRLALGGNSESDLDPRLRPIPSKFFSCNFCKRKFYSSHALGGHQNVHKRERGAARRSQSQRMMNLPMSCRALGVQPHSLVHKPTRDGTAAASVARFSDPYTVQFTVDDGMDFMWPGSFRLDPPPAEPSEVDLNLRL